MRPPTRIGGPSASACRLLARDSSGCEERGTHGKNDEGLAADNLIIPQVRVAYVLRDCLKQHTDCDGHPEHVADGKDPRDGRPEIPGRAGFDTGNSERSDLDQFPH